jgi:signal transduction histidine kinase
VKLRPRLAITVLAAAVPLTGAIAWIRADLEHRTRARVLRDLVLSSMENGGREACEAWPETFPRGFDPLAWASPEVKDSARESGSAIGRNLAPRPGPRPELGRKDHGWMPRGTGGGPGGPDGLRGGHGGPGGPGGPGGGPDGPERPGFGPGFGPGLGPRRPPPHGRIEIFAYDSTFVSANLSAPDFPEELRKGLEGGADSASCPFRTRTSTGLQVAVRMPWKDGPCDVVLARNPTPVPPAIDVDLLGASLVLTAGFLGVVLLAAGPLVRRVRRLTADVRRSAADRYATPVGITGHDEISQLATAFNDAGKELRTHLAALEKREETLRSFVGNTTHDVMLPLTVLQGHLSALRDGIEAGGEPERATVQDALEEAHYMASLVQNLGAAVKLEAGEAHIQRHPVNLNDLVERVMGRHRPIARQKEVHLDFSVPESPLWTEGDLTLIEQAVSNVVHNAVRYNRAGGHVAVVLEEGRPDPSRFSLRVADDGPGISEEALARISERSFRTDEARRRCPEGLGLGLHIAKSVAERHGFELRISRPEAGGLDVELAGKLITAA